MIMNTISIISFFSRIIIISCTIFLFFFLISVQLQGFYGSGYHGPLPYLTGRSAG